MASAPAKWPIPRDLHSAEVARNLLEARATHAFYVYADHAHYLRAWSQLTETDRQACDKPIRCRKCGGDS
jgi:hypothetical protein